MAAPAVTAASGGGTGTGTQATINTPMDFANALLAQLHAPATPSNQNFIVAWESAEGGNWNNSAAYNPLNTTQYAPGAGTINSAGVKSYQSWDQGVSATAETLNNGYYPAITQALQSGDAAGAFQAGQLTSNLNTWGTTDQNNIASNLGGTSYANITGGAGTNSSTSGAASSGSGSGSGPTGLMSNCYQYGLSKNSNGNSCLISPPGGWCFTACEAKALVSGLLILSGGLLMLVGTALLFADKGGLLGKAADAAGAVYLVKGVSRTVQAHAPRSGGLSDSAQRKASYQSRAKTGGGPAREVSHPADEGEF